MYYLVYSHILTPYNVCYTEEAERRRIEEEEERIAEEELKSKMAQDERLEYERKKREEEEERIRLEEEAK